MGILAQVNTYLELGFFSDLVENKDCFVIFVVLIRWAVFARLISVEILL
jgi:hypothetical protein